MNKTPKRLLKVFLCHTSADKPAVRALYRKLSSVDWIDPWLDEEKLLPGQDWNLEIQNAIDNADAILICISSNSISKEGYLQKEIKKALERAEEKPDGTIFIIPVRLEECDPPAQLRRWQWVDLHSTRGYEWLTQGLRARWGILYDVETSNDIMNNNSGVSTNAIATLFVLQSDEFRIVGQTIEINNRYTTMGRSSDNDIIFAHDAPVSRHQAAIELHDRKFYIRELSANTEGVRSYSKFGTFVNNEQILKPTQLSNGDEIRLGKRVKLRFEINSES